MKGSPLKALRPVWRPSSPRPKVPFSLRTNAPRRQWLGVLVCVALVWMASACTLAYDPSEVPFEDRLLTGPAQDTGQDDADAATEDADATLEDTPPPQDVDRPEDVSPTDAPPEDVPPEDAPPEDTGPDAPPRVPGLGVACGPSVVVGDDCGPESAGWPACADAPCKEALGDAAVCARGYGLFGYCTLPCDPNGDASACVADASAPWDAAMRCVAASSNASGGWCRFEDGACDDDLDCDAGYACALTRDDPADMSGSAWSQRCRPTRSSAAGRGEPCNDDPSRGQVVLCANDLCLDDVCAALCAATGAPPNSAYCRSDDLRCTAESEAWLAPDRLGAFAPGPETGLCAPKPCTTPDVCSDEGLCGLVGRSASVTDGLVGTCRTDNPRQEGSLPLGEPCGLFGNVPDSARCASRTCVGRAPNYYCTAICGGDSDCGDGQICEATQLRLTSDITLFTPLCSYARGSRSPCTRNDDCVASEVCAPFIRGEVAPSGQGILGGRVERLCVTPSPSGVPSGRGCAEQECAVPGSCVPVPDGVAVCANLCDDDFDCAFDETCTRYTVLSDEEHLDGDALTQGYCVPN